MPLITTYLRILVSEFRGYQGKCLGAQGDQVCGRPSEEGLTQVLPTLRIPLKQVNADVKDGKSTSNSVLTLLTCDQLLENHFMITA